MPAPGRRWLKDSGAEAGVKRPNLMQLAGWRVAWPIRGCRLTRGARLRYLRRPRPGEKVSQVAHSWATRRRPLRQAAWDEPGAGRSSDLPAGFRLVDYASCLAALIERLDLGPTHIAGHS